MRNRKLHVTEIRDRLRYWQKEHGKAEIELQATRRWNWRKRSAAKARLDVAMLVIAELNNVLHGGRN